MKTEILKIDPFCFSPRLLRRPSLILRKGGLVIFPTETVYGIGIRAGDPAARHRLCALKERDPEKPLTIHIAWLEDLKKIVQNVPPMARRLMDRYWPGPLTLVLETEGKRAGVRFPSNPAARFLIENAGVLVSASSANLSGQEPCWEGRAVKHLFDGKVDCIVDGGDTPLKQPSTVVLVSPGRWEMLREGIIDRRGIIRTVCLHILFVCSGNTCRSPLAENLMKKILAEKFSTSTDRLEEFGFSVASAGLKAQEGSGASENAKKIAEEMGFSLSKHLARNLSLEEAESADILFAMDLSNLIMIRSSVKNKAKARLLGPRGREIADPYGKGRKEYRKSARIIERGVKEAVKEICGSE